MIWDHGICNPTFELRSPWPSQSLVAWESQSPCGFCGCCVSIAALRAWKRWEAGIGPGIPKRIKQLLPLLFQLHLPSCRFVGHSARLPGFTFGSGRLAALFTFRQCQVRCLHSALRKQYTCDHATQQVAEVFFKLLTIQCLHTYCATHTELMIDKFS